MKWKQFLTPVKSISYTEAKTIVDSLSAEKFQLLDVRQETEYNAAHIPGAILIPLGDLNTRYVELEREKKIIVYCAVGGRSRVATQMLATKGFTDIYNLSGGINSWENEVAIGPQDSGLAIYSELNSVKEAIVIGFGVEQGLREFYLKMSKEVTTEQARELFLLLAEIEIKHQHRLLDIYNEITDSSASMQDFTSQTLKPSMEGGISTDQYIELFNPDLNSEFDILSLAMSIEAQALDLYTRAASITDDKDIRATFFQIAAEEKIHLNKLAEYIENI